MSDNGKRSLDCPHLRCIFYKKCQAAGRVCSARKVERGTSRAINCEKCFLRKSGACYKQDTKQDKDGNPCGTEVAKPKLSHRGRLRPSTYQDDGFLTCWIVHGIVREDYWGTTHWNDEEHIYDKYAHLDRRILIPKHGPVMVAKNDEGNENPGTSSGDTAADPEACWNEYDPWTADLYEGENWYIPEDVLIDYPQLKPLLSYWYPDKEKNRYLVICDSWWYEPSPPGTGHDSRKTARAMNCQGRVYGNRPEGVKVIPHSQPPVFKDPDVADMWREDVTKHILNGRKRQKPLNPMKQKVNIKGEIIDLLIYPLGNRYLSFREISETWQLNNIKYISKLAHELKQNIIENYNSSRPHRIKMKQMQYFLMLLLDRLSPSQIAKIKGVSKRAVNEVVDAARKKILTQGLLP